jgi:hypothetical protein
MRNVYPTDEIAHLFAHQTQGSARNAGGNFSFSGSTLFSYAQPIAYIMPDDYGRIVLMNDARYSNTTGKHQNHARHAFGNLWNRIFVDGFGDNETRNISRYGAADICVKLRNEMRTAIDRAAAPRIRPDTRAGHLHAAANCADYIRTLAEIDAKRKNIRKEDRAAARAMLRSLPTQHALNNATESKETAAALAAIHAREIAAERMQRAISDAQCAAHDMVESEKHAEYLRQHPTESRNRYVQPARDALRHADRVRANFNVAIEAAKLAKRRLPPRFVKECREVIARIPELNTAAQWEARAEWLESWEIFKERPLDAYGTGKLNDMESAASVLAQTDTEAEKAKRAAAIEQVKVELREYTAAAAPGHVANHVAAARRALPSTYFDSAARSLHAARLWADKATDEARPELLDTIEAVQRELDAATAAERAAALPDWYAGRRQTLPEYLHTDGARLRVAGDTIQTSRGARVPLSVAPMLWRMVTRARAIGMPCEFNPPQSVGHYALEKIGADGSLTIGCHFIAYAELEKLARELELTP